eukprot:PhF_6_TR25550/c0_g2_i1/m.35852
MSCRTSTTTLWYVPDCDLWTLMPYPGRKGNCFLYAVASGVPVNWHENMILGMKYSLSVESGLTLTNLPLGHILVITQRVPFSSLFLKSMFRNITTIMFSQRTNLCGGTPLKVIEFKSS